jgi:hypothetical protein
MDMLYKNITLRYKRRYRPKILSDYFLLKIGIPRALYTFPIVLQTTQLPEIATDGEWAGDNSWRSKGDGLGIVADGSKVGWDSSRRYQ